MKNLLQKRRQAYPFTTTLPRIAALILCLSAGAFRAQAQFGLSFDIKHVLCGQMATGEVTARPSGGQQPYRYLWSTGDTTATIRRLPPGDYRVTVTDAASGSVSASATVNGSAMLMVAMETNHTCSGPVTVTASGNNGVPPYKYEWDKGLLGPTQTFTMSGSYCVTVSDTRLCATIECVKLTIEPLSLFLLPRNVTCPEGTDGAINIALSGGVAPYTYLWNNGATTPTLSGVGGGTYRLTVTDARGCTISAAATVTAPPAFTINFLAQAPSCPGIQNGSIQVQSVTGGTPPYRISWNTGQLLPNLASLTEGQFTLYVKDAAECIVTRQIALTPRSNLNITARATDETCAGASNGSMVVNAENGVGPYTYSWNPAGPSSYLRTGLAPRSYSVTVTDAAGCQRSTSATVNAAAPVSLAITKSDVASCTTPFGRASAVVSGGTGPYTYFWSNGSRTATLDNLAAGTYALTVTDALGCTKTATTTILPPPAVSLQVSATPGLCTGTSTGVASALASGGTTPFSYSWSNGGATQGLTGLAPGLYRVTVTDAKGCTASGSANINSLPKPDATVIASGILCGGNNIGSARVSVTGGVPTYTYRWSNGSTASSLSNLGSGTYTVTVTDANNCRDTAQGAVDIVPTIALSTQPAHVLCQGTATGSVLVNASGGRPPYSYLWNTGIRQAQMGGLAAGTYSVTVTDAEGCRGTTSVSITQPAALSLSLLGTDALCGDIATTSAQAIAGGGVGPYTYRWSNGSTSSGILGVLAGTYTATVTDANGCTLSKSVNILNPGIPECSIVNIRPPSFPGASDGSASVELSGGTGPYTVLWKNGRTSTSVSNLSNGDYAVTVQDAKRCTSNCQVAVTITNALVGDCVWFDQNRNGIQDAGEKGVGNIPVTITPIGAIPNFPAPVSTRTDSKGKYQFIVPPGSYKITFSIPDTLQLTRNDVGENNESDSDANRDTYMTPVFQISAGQTDLSWDAGLVPETQFIPSPGCVCLNNATARGNGQFSDRIVLNGLPGDIWRITSQNGMYLSSSPAPPATPLSVPAGTVLTEVQPGIYQYDFRHVDGVGYDIELTNGRESLALENACSYPRVQGTFPDTFCLNDGPYTPAMSGSVAGTLSYFLNNQRVSTINPSALGIGLYTLTARLDPFDPAQCEAVENFPFRVVIENCPVKIGDYAWYDINQDGKQNSTESGIAGIKVYLRNPARPNVNLDSTVTDAQGRYCFFVRPGNYQLLFLTPPGSRWEVTAPHKGEDNLDSDIDTSTHLTPIYTIFTGIDNLSIDAGFYLGCDNVTDPGLIGHDQVLCGPGLDPSPIQNLRTPSGGEGDLEYVWMFSYVDGVFNTTTYQPVPNSNSPTLDPGPLDRTAFFVRCVRRAGCSTFKEPSPVKVTVEDKAAARILASTYYCQDRPISVKVETKTTSAYVRWTFTVTSGQFSVSPTSALGQVATLTANGSGTVEARVWVTENGCTIESRKTFNVTTSPAYCTSGDGLLTLNGLMDENHQVNLRWRMREDFLDYTFRIEHAQDGERWTPMQETSRYMAQDNGFNYYEYRGKAPNYGLNFYRVIGKDGFGNTFQSNVISFAARMESSGMAHLYPNPATDQLTLDLLRDLPDGTAPQIEILQPNGRLVRSWNLKPGQKQEHMDCSELPAGVYFLRIKTAEMPQEILKFIKR